MAIAKKMIDVSAYQGDIDWNKVKETDVEYVILRMGTGYGGNHLDAKFAQNITQCNKLNIPVGVYWFSYATNVNEAIAEAQYVVVNLKPYRVDLPVVYDFEYDSVKKAKAKGINVTKALATAMAKAFLNVIQSNKYYAMIYANGDYLNNYFDATIPKTYDLWYAAWPTKQVNWKTDRPSRSCGIWQYGSSLVDGILSKDGKGVDSNVAYRDYVSIIQKNKLNHLSEHPALGTVVEEPKPSTPSTTPTQQEAIQVRLTSAKAYLRTVNSEFILKGLANLIYINTKKPVVKGIDNYDTYMNYIANNSLEGTHFLIDLSDYLKTLKK